MRSDLAQTVSARCMVSGPADFYEPFEEWTGRLSALSSVVEAFRSNLRATRLVGSLPFQLVQSGVLQRRFDRLRLAELIESGAEPDSELYSEQQEQADRRANEAMRELAASTEFIDQVTDELWHILDHSLQTPDFSEASHELLRQVLVMIWGALEVVSTDLGIVIVNKRPALARCVLELASNLRAAGRLMPVAQAYNVTMYVMAGLLVVGFLCNLFVRSVHERFHMRAVQAEAKVEAAPIRGSQ